MKNLEKTFWDNFMIARAAMSSQIVTVCPVGNKLAATLGIHDKNERHMQLDQIRMLEALLREDGGT